MNERSVEIVRANNADIDLAKEFIFKYGPTEYNPIEPDSINQEFEDILTGLTICFKAVIGERLVGLATCNMHRKFPQYEQADRSTGYLSQNVVLPELRGRGIGSKLVNARQQFLLDQGVEAIYVTHHADNSGSAGALQHAGFNELDTYDDFEKRRTGSRKTTVRRFEMEKAS